MNARRTTNHPVAHTYPAPKRRFSDGFLGFNLFSKEQDVQLGKENADQVRKQMTVIRDPVLAAYVTRVGQRPMSAREAWESGFPVYL